MYGSFKYFWLLTSFRLELCLISWQCRTTNLKFHLVQVWYLLWNLITFQKCLLLSASIALAAQTGHEQLHLILCWQFSNIQVSRRYKHFDWLHERLVEKFCTLAIPPLPEKQISGKKIWFNNWTDYMIRECCQPSTRFSYFYFWLTDVKYLWVSCLSTSRTVCIFPAENCSRIKCQAIRAKWHVKNLTCPNVLDAAAQSMVMFLMFGGERSWPVLEIPTSSKVLSMKLYRGKTAWKECQPPADDEVVDLELRVRLFLGSAA